MEEVIGPGLVIREVAFGSDLYEQMAFFRDLHLGRPLGMVLAAEDVAGEGHETHIAALRHGHVVGTVLLKPLSPTRIRLRQMAVDPALRGAGLGAGLARFAERLAHARGFETVEISAHKTAAGYYEKLGYEPVGHRVVQGGAPYIVLTRSLGS